jgi:Family of unknown function (DUF6166)
MLETDLTGEGAIDAVMKGLAGVDLYLGMKVEGNIVVTADSVIISPRRSLAVRNHSPDGFNWGYGGSGPAQLALAILLHEGLPTDIACRLYQRFKFKFVASWDGDANWLLRGTELRAWIGLALLAIAKGQAEEREEEKRDA